MKITINKAYTGLVRTLLRTGNVVDKAVKSVKLGAKCVAVEYRALSAEYCDNPECHIPVGIGGAPLRYCSKCVDAGDANAKYPHEVSTESEELRAKNEGLSETLKTEHEAYRTVIRTLRGRT